MALDERIRVFGDHDDATIAQLERCVAAEDGARGVLCADGHLGYSQPIGGVVAYREHLSPSGVGFDIGCVAAGTPVTSEDGWSAPIEHVGPGAPATCWDGAGLRTARPCLGAVARGRAAVVRVRLAGGREILVTPEHEFRTKLGWARADRLRTGEPVAVVPFVGVSHEHAAIQIDVPVKRGDADLRALGLLPLRTDDDRFPALLRTLASTCGDGHLHGNGHRVSLSSSVPEDAIALRDDLVVLGFHPVLDIRERGGNVQTQYVVRVRSVGLHALLAGLGCPVGSKATAWKRDPMPWLFGLPAWMRAHFLSAFASAAATTPAIIAGRVANLAIKQAGTEQHAITLVAELLRSLGFRVGVSVSGPEREGIRTWVAQIVGGEDEQLRFSREIGFCRAVEKRRAAARMLSFAALGSDELRRRGEAIAEGQRLRGAPRPPKGWLCNPDHSNEVAWLRVIAVEPAGESEVFDVATGDEAESFVAGGIVVHNCGNKAVRTDLRADAIRADLPRLMDEIIGRVEFGMGRTNDRRVEHPVLDEIKNAAFAPQRRLRKLAAEQLGTVGAGNHYVNILEDEDGWAWVGVHFGSRGFGHRTASGFLALAQGRAFDDHPKDTGMDAPPVLLHERYELGQGYLAAMSLAARYAYAGRDIVVDEVLGILGATATDEVHNNHNELWRETHDGEDLWVVRKGATPAFPGQRGFVGASMGEPSVILEGVDSPASTAALHSTVHGAGRALSRTQAAGKLRKRWMNNLRADDTLYGSREEALAVPGARSARSVRVREGGRIDFRAVKGELRAKGIELRGGAADEAPGAYKRLGQVLAYHEGTVRILHTLTPLGVAMAGEDTYDPYKD